ncbi:PAS domain S-box-containing protein [Archangium gephyra]|uniref:histidine kinase n=1 Tax=Archangium gephyra TaxID=48 RepID=A0AAC8TD29_9BACT|nr:PAS domain-containing protein [Archangium gephyra]AKJ01422.1 Chemotaxis protein methyltransferase CheR [Archangium gephyra]REG34236.1 PAS domain S-box-containing protein [Archangium gephyra]
MTTVDGHAGEVRREASLRSFPELLLQVGESLQATLVVDAQGRIARIDSTLAVAAGWGDGVPPEGRPLEEVLLLFPWLVDALRTALTGTEAVSEGGERDRWMRALVLPVFGNDGQCLGACTRLSERAPAKPESSHHAALEQELTRTQRQYAELLDTIDGIVWEADVNFRFSFVNKQSERLLGHPPRQWLQEPDFWKNHVHPEDREWAQAYCLKATRERRPYEFEYRMLAADGRVVWLRTIVTVLAEDGRPLKLRGIMVDVTEQRLAREKLEQTASLLRATFDSVTDGVLVVSRNQRITAFNKRFQQLWGYSDEALQGMPDPKQTLPAAIAQAKDPERFLARIREMYADPEREGVDIVELHNGLILQRTTIPQRLGSTIIGRIWSYRDVTEERRAQEKLEQTFSLLRATFDSIADGVVVVDGDQKITAFNKRFQQLWRLPDAALTEGLDAVQAVLAAAPLVKEPEQFVSRLRDMFVLSDREAIDTVELRDGRIFENTTMPQRMGDTIIGRVWSYRDVTEQRRAKAEQERLLVAEKHAREQLEESLAVLDTFLNNAPIGMGFLDRDLRFLQVNDALAALHGKTREEELGRALREVAPLIAANVEPLMRQVLETGEPLIGLDLALEVPATPGRLRYWRVSYYPVRTTSGRIVGLGAVVVELTAERQAQEERERLLHEAREAIQTRDDFLCVASHELKTPLTPLKLHLQRLKRKCASGQPLPPQDAEKALAQVDRLSGLISDMLDSSQIEAGRLELIREPLPLQDVLREALEDFRPACAQHPLEYEECAEELVVLGDRERLAQVLANLLENARKYSPLKGPIRVTLTRNGAEALVSVSDSGIGIPADQQAHLFERFFRARNAPVSCFGGLGLGLYICRHLVEHHGGRIWAESQDGQGTTFRFTLPVEAPPPGRA